MFPLNWILKMSWVLIREGRLNKHEGKYTQTNSPKYLEISQFSTVGLTMGIQFLFLTCLCVTFSLILLAEINGNPNDASVLNQVMKKFTELQKIISLQDERISELEKRQVGPDGEAVVELEKNPLKFRKLESVS